MKHPIKRESVKLRLMEKHQENESVQVVIKPLFVMQINVQHVTHLVLSNMMFAHQEKAYYRSLELGGGYAVKSIVDYILCSNIFVFHSC